MSVQFGKWDFENQALSKEFVDRAAMILAPYGPDGADAYCNGGVSIVFRAFHTTVESRNENQPHKSKSGAIITWDGRLDNRADLLATLGTSLNAGSTDVEIVSASYDKWNWNCFDRLIGDWALSIWDPDRQCLLLATDSIGIRHLYYSISGNSVTWSTILEPLVRFSNKTVKVCEEYVAGWFAGQVAPHLTPYVDIYTVPPSCVVVIRPRSQTINKYWDFDPEKTIRYQSNEQYEEHFRNVFALAVRRRLRCDRPILAELSGGMDSSSIVCMADRLLRRGEAETPRLDTISYYDATDAILDERRYVTKVEQTRGRTGYHIDLAMNNPELNLSPFPGFEDNRLLATPNSDRNLWPKLFNDYAFYVRSQDYRVILSGIGGEDPTGGYVPSPTLELQDLIVRGQLTRFLRQLHTWSAKIRRSWLSLLREAALGFIKCSPTFTYPYDSILPPPWLQASFVKRNEQVFRSNRPRLKHFGPLPSFQHHIYQLNRLREYLASRDLWPELLREIRYPYLDRDFLEFAYAIPREQLVGIGKRRFLMKRSLVGIVPDELLDRKRRAVPSNKPQKDDFPGWITSDQLRQPFISSSLGIVDTCLLSHAIQNSDCFRNHIVFSLISTFALEVWLRHLVSHGVLRIKTPTERDWVAPLWREGGHQPVFKRESSAG